MQDAEHDAPIQDVLRTLANNRGLPANALRACVARIDEAAPALLEVLGRAAAGKPLNVPDSSLLFFGLHILAAARVTATFPLLLRLLRRPAEEVDELMGDALTETTAKVLASTYDGSVDGLLALIADRRIGEITRWLALDALTWLTWSGQVERDLTERFLTRLWDETVAEPTDSAWFGWLTAVGVLGFDRMAGQALASWTPMMDSYITPNRYREMLADAAAAPRDRDRVEAEGLGTIDDVVQSLNWIMQAPAEEPVPEPMVNPLRGVGRNDPCPCGSGRKYKKCCLT